jgi:hypothetical protein
MRHRTRTRLPTLPFALAILLAACGPSEPLDQRLERDLLTRQKEALERELVRRMEVLDSDIVVAVPSTLIDELLQVALPVEAVIGDRFRIVADGGEVDFEGGLALVRLRGEVAMADRESVAARIEIAGILQVLEIEGAGTLATRVEILGWRTEEVRFGTRSPPVGRLLDELAARPAGDLNALLSRIEIPVRLLPTIPLPRVAENEVTIPAAEIPLDARVDEVRVGGGRLWVHIDVGVPEESR